MMKGAEIGHTYGALGRDFDGVYREIRRLAAEPQQIEGYIDPSGEGKGNGHG